MRGKALGSSCHTRQELQEGRSTQWTQTRCRLWQDSGKQKRAAGPNKVLEEAIESSDNFTEALNYLSLTAQEVNMSENQQKACLSLFRVSM